MFIFGLWTMLVALTISAVAAYYSIIGLVAIFSAAMLPIIIMGAALEVGKLTTAVWLHMNWHRAKWLMKSYLSFALIVLMFITSMGIFGFLSKAHIEQTAATGESQAQVLRIETEVARLEGVIARAEQKIQKLENTGTGSDANIQTQIDKEQERIDKAFERIQPAIAQQNKIIADARESDKDRTKPYEEQLTNIQKEVSRLTDLARSYEDKIANLKADDGVVSPLLKQIDGIEQEIIRVTNQLNSKEQQQIRAAQAIIGVTNDGLFGGNTRSALAKWVQGQRDLINKLQGEVAKARQGEKDTVDAERTRLAGIVKDIRQVQIPALKDRELTMLGKIDEVRATESPVIQTARDEISRLRKSAEEQVANSQKLIERLRGQLSKQDKAAEIDKAIDEQNVRIKTANAEIDTLTEEKYKLEAQYRALEAEVGPVKYIAEFIYGEAADRDILEEAVRWVILILVLVFDPLAVVLVIAGLTLLEHARKGKHPPPQPAKKPEPEVEPEQEEHQEPEVDKEEWQKTEEMASDVIELQMLQDSIDDGKGVSDPEPEPEDPQRIYQDEETGAYYRMVNGQRKFIIDPGQILVNQQFKEEKYGTREKIDSTIAKMKEEGRWPNAPETTYDTEADAIRDIMKNDKDGELEELLEKADQKTLQDVYDEMLKDMNPKGNK